MKKRAVLQQMVGAKMGAMAKAICMRSVVPEIRPVLGEILMALYRHMVLLLVNRLNTILTHQ